MILWNKFKSHGASNFFIMLQIVILLTYCFVEFCSIKSTFWMSRDIRNKLGNSYSRTIHFEVHDETEKEAFETCKKALLDTGQYESIYSYDNRTIFQSDGIDEIETIELGKGIEKILSPKIAQGRFFREEDFTGKKTPVVIGPDIAGKFHLKPGERLEDHGINAKGTVIGVLEDDQSWLFGDYASAQSTILDNQLLVLSNNDKVLLHYYGVLKPETDKASALQQAEQIISGQHLIMSATDLEKQLQEQQEMTRSENRQWMMFTVVILLMIAVGTALVIYARIYQQKKEIGIYMAFGYSHKKILGYQTGEMGIVGMTGYIISLAASVILIGNGKSVLGSLIIYNGMSLDLFLISLGFLIMILILTPSLLMMIAGILPLQPSALIGGKNK